MSDSCDAVNIITISYCIVELIGVILGQSQIRFSIEIDLSMHQLTLSEIIIHSPEMFSMLCVCTRERDFIERHIHPGHDL